MSMNKNDKSADCRDSYSLLQKIAGIDLAWAVGRTPAVKQLHLYISMIRNWYHRKEEIRDLSSFRGIVSSDTKRLKEQ
jgi:hypothetical protein